MMKIYKKAYIGEDAMKLLDSYGYSLIDSKNFKNYELYLFKFSGHIGDLAKESGVPLYQIGVQRNDTDFTDLEQQNQSNPPSEDFQGYEGVLAWFNETLSTWLSQYGPLMIMSHSEKKQRVYKGIINRIGLPTKFMPFMNYNVMVVG